jgi:hypothetical protein
MWVRRSVWAGGILVALVVCWSVVLFLAAIVAKLSVPVTLPSMSVVQVDGLVRVQGTWTIEGELQASPLQTTEIDCWAESRTCQSATATVSKSGRLDVLLDPLPVRQWTDSHIEFTDDSPSCVRYVYTINTVTKSVSGIRQRKHTDRDPVLGCDQLNEELRLTMHDGFDVWRPLADAALPWYGRAALTPLSWF